MEFRKATIDDLSSIKEIEDESFHKPFELKDLEYEINENPFSEYIVAVEDGIILGFINFWITFDSATINQIAVRKNSRKKGLGTKLIEFCEVIIKEEGAEFLTLEVRKSNIPAISLYEKTGFTKITIKEKYYDDGEDAIFMVKGEI